VPDGPFDPKLFELFKKLTAALVQYTPEHFKNIICTITEGKEGGQRALFYNISCPEFPDEGTTNVNAGVHTAATALVQYWSSRGDTFPGIKVTLTQQADGNWRNNIRRLDAEPDAPPQGSAPKFPSPARRPAPPRPASSQAAAKPWWQVW